MFDLGVQAQRLGVGAQVIFHLRNRQAVVRGQGSPLLVVQTLRQEVRDHLDLVRELGVHVPQFVERGTHGDQQVVAVGPGFARALGDRLARGPEHLRSKPLWLGR
jgi:hypothetical protein